MKPTEDQKRIKELRKHLADLTNTVMLHVHDLDELLGSTKNLATAKSAALARLTNQIEIENDKARYFGLGLGISPEDKAKLLMKLLKKRKG